MADPTFQIPKDIIDPIIKAHVNEAVLRALDGPNHIVSTAILNVMNVNVDSDGKPSSYNGVPWIDWVIGDCVKKSVRAVIEEQLKTHADQLKAALTRELSTRNSKLVKQLVEGMAVAMTHPDTLKYRLNVTYDEKQR